LLVSNRCGIEFENGAQGALRFAIHADVQPRDSVGKYLEYVAIGKQLVQKGTRSGTEKSTATDDPELFA
jgi:hypothetical protein